MVPAKIQLRLGNQSILYGKKPTILPWFPRPGPYQHQLPVIRILQFSTDLENHLNGLKFWSMLNFFLLQKLQFIELLINKSWVRSLYMSCFDVSDLDLKAYRLPNGLLISANLPQFQFLSREWPKSDLPVHLVFHPKKHLIVAIIVLYSEHLIDPRDLFSLQLIENCPLFEFVEGRQLELNKYFINRARRTGTYELRTYQQDKP